MSLKVQEGIDNKWSANRVSFDGTKLLPEGLVMPELRGEQQRPNASGEIAMLSGDHRSGPFHFERTVMAESQCIENHTFDEIGIGDEASLSRTLTWRDIELFAAQSDPERLASSATEIRDMPMVLRADSSTARTFCKRKSATASPNGCLAPRC